jgi:glycosyltransferase involved in cell wall biosynthesis
MHVIAMEIEPSNRRGGQELSLLDVLRGVAQRGHHVSFLYAVEGNLLPEYRQFCKRIEKVGGYMIDKSRPWRTASRLLMDVVKIRRVFATVGDGVVYANQFDDTPFASLLAKTLGMPSVCHLRQPGPSRLRLQNRDMLRSLTRFIAVSQETRRGWIASGLPADRIGCVYNGVDTNKFKPAAPQRNFRSELNFPDGVPLIAYVGRVDKVKGIETLLQALAMLHERGIAFRAVIAGKPFSPAEPRLADPQQTARDLGIGDFVHFIGHVADPRDVYRSADVTVLPSEWNEPFGRTIIESMSCGTPVVATRVGGIPEILTGKFADMLVPPAEPAILADTLARVARWRHDCPALADACREHVRAHFDVAATIEAVTEVLLETAVAGRAWRPNAKVELASGGPLG